MVGRLALLLLSACACAGCYAFSTVIAVNGDGSGTILQRIFVPPEALAQIRGAAGRRAAGFDPMPDVQARARTAAFGPDVTFVSSTPIDTGLGLGRDITYAFPDIGHVRLDELPPALGGAGVQAPGAVDSHISFALTRQPGGSALLRLRLPQLALLREAVPYAGRGTISPDQMAVLRQMFAGAHLFIAVEPAGDLVRASSPYVDGRRVIVMDLDADDVLGDEATLLGLREAGTPDAVREAVRDLPRARISLEPEMTIEFLPAR